MNLKIARDKSVDELGDTAARLSEHAMYALAQVMQVVGLSHIVISWSDTMSGKSFSVKEYEFFPHVPEQIMKWSEGSVVAVGHLMSVFGVSSLSVSPGPSDAESPQTSVESDLLSLERMWSSISSMSDGRVRTVVPRGQAVDTPYSMVKDWESSIASDGRQDSSGVILL